MMKSVKPMLTTVVAFAAMNGFSEDRAYRNLLSMWRDAEGAAVSDTFRDSVRVTINSAKYGISKGAYSLKKRYSISSG